MQNVIDDEYIIDLFFGPRQLRKKTYNKYLNDKLSSEYRYIINRYKDSKSFKESLYRIKHGIEIRPICEECKGELKFVPNNKKPIFNRFCSKHCANNNELSKQRLKETCMQKYGATNVAKSKYFKDKYIKHIREKYHDDTIVNAWQAPEVITKIKRTCIEKYGVSNFGLTAAHQNKLKSKDVVNRREATKRRNHTFNTSKPESESYKLLKERYPDVIYQYKSDLYPFACDFYIPSLDLYIECNYHWTHGGKPFEDTDEDQNIVNTWKLRNTKFYNNAIQCWTVRDVKKRQTAKDNNLNYIEFWSINELKDWLHLKY